VLCAGECLVWLRLDELAQGAPCVNYVVEIGTRRAMDEMSIGLPDLMFAEILAYLDIAFV
jgi:hypothetical protein